MTDGGDKKPLHEQSFEEVYRAYEDYLYLINASMYTRKAYLYNFRRYYLYCESIELSLIYSQESVKGYLVYRVREGAAWQTMNNIYSAMRKLFREVLNLPWSFKKLPRAKKERHLPEILSQEEVELLIRGCGKNLKHKAMMITLYSTGLRVGELTRLRVEDVQSDRQQLRVVKGKGRKDRYVDIPEVLVEVLRAYYKKYRPTGLLFTGRDKCSSISISAVRWGFRQSRKRVGLRKKASPHTFRHCYATHHLENGTDLVYLQKNLGHKHLKTTARYIHLCKERYQHISHPIDKMELPLE